jgi:hypothetical protein
MVEIHCYIVNYTFEDSGIISNSSNFDVKFIQKLANRVAHILTRAILFMSSPQFVYYVSHYISYIIFNIKQRHPCFKRRDKWLLIKLIMMVIL